MIKLTGRALLRDGALSREWLETNGRGGYASSTILNCHTRKYHGLLVAHLPESGGRFVLLSKLDDCLHRGNVAIPLSMHHYPDVFDPGELSGLAQFELKHHPRFIYQAGDVLFEKSIMLVRDADTLLVRYSYLEGTESLGLTINPFLAFRGIHDLTGENSFFRAETEQFASGFSVAPYEGLPRLYVAADDRLDFSPGPLWYRSFEYDTERDRGFPFHEDLLSPGRLHGSLQPGSSVTVSFSLEEIASPEQAWTDELAGRERRRTALRRKVAGASSLVKSLTETAESFLIRDGAGNKAIIAGYHWFYVWGRDTLISLPGLTFCRGRMREGLDVLRVMGEARRNGLIPNCLSDREDNEPAYNSVDASLWYFWCIQEYLRMSGDIGTIKRRFWPVMKDIVNAFREAASDNPVVRLESGLLAVGDKTTQLTWMDATVDSLPVTPRSGCPVEINALWYNALSFTREVAKLTGMDPGFDTAAEMERTRQAFNDLFWISDGEYLADVWNTTNGSRDESVRPNQIFAVSLPYSPLDGMQKARKVVKRVTDELLTPCGLRTLSPHDERYRGTYGGDARSRDSAYHQGTVWPWLLGHYGDALMKTSRNKKATRKTLRGIISRFEYHLEQAGIGSISEVFDGDKPHNPGGCIAQAWSVAEIVRLSRMIEAED